MARGRAAIERASALRAARAWSACRHGMRRAGHRRVRNRRHVRCARPVAGRLARRLGPARAARSTPGSGEIAMTSARVGFIGLGAMGSRMAGNLQSSGCDLVVYNRTRDKAASLVSKGASWADTPAAVADQAEILFTMLAHPAAVEEAALGQDGFLYPLPAASSSSLSAAIRRTWRHVGSCCRPWGARSCTSEVTAWAAR